MARRDKPLVLMENILEQRIKNWLEIKPIGNVNDMTTWPFNGYVSMPDLPKILNSAFPYSNNLVGAEIGVSRGEGSTYLLHNCKKVSCLYAIDAWKEYDDNCGDGFFPQIALDHMKSLTLINTKQFGDRIKLVEKDSVDAAKDFADESLDFVFIDADHSYEGVLRDMEAYWSKVKPGGLFSGHDWWHEPLQKGVFEFLEKHASKDNLFFFRDTCWGIIKQ